MAELNWVGPEVHIGQACAITGFEIHSIKVKKRKGEIRAKGTLTVRDYGEHAWDFTEDWKANAAKNKFGYRVWTVEYDRKTFVLEEKDYANAKNYLYKGSSGYLVSLPEEKWIVGMIEEFVKKGREALEEKEYAGPMDAYAGPCVCEELSQNQITHDRWLELTNQGRFSNHCFRCSCGKCWHYLDVDRKKGWSQVSEKAFALLTKYNGKVMRSMHIHKGIACLTDEIGGHWVA